MEETVLQPPTSSHQPPNFGVPQAILAGLGLIAVSIYLSFGVNNTPSLNPSPQEGVKEDQIVEVSADDDVVLGLRNSPVEIIEFSDFQCPYCRSFWRDTFAQIKKEYIDTGKVKLVYRDFPLDNIHAAARTAAEVGECAADQGKFWEFHDAVYAEQDKKGTGTVQFSEADVKTWAGDTGLNLQDLNSCFDSGRYKEEVEKDLQDGIAAGVQGTPTFFINGRLLTGARAYAVFQSIIDAELKK